MRYVTQSVLLVLGLFAGVYAALILVFVIEKLDFLLQAAIDYNVPLDGFLLLLVAYMPIVADFILPVAALVSVYLVLLYKRENREFLILASAGIGMRPTLAIAGILGLIFAASSLLVSGYIKPAASDIFHGEFNRAIDDAVIAGPRSGHFVIEDNSVFHVSGVKPGGIRDLQIFKFERGALSQVLLSACARLAIHGGEVFANLCSLEVRTFGDGGLAGAAAEGQEVVTEPDCRICPDASGNLHIETLQAGASSMNTRIGRLAGTGADTRRTPLFHEMLAVGDTGFVSEARARDAAKALMMALSCLISVAIAVVAAAGTTNSTRFIMLPGAIAIAAIANVAAAAGLLVPSVALSPAGFSLFFGLAVALALMAIPLSIRFLGERLLAPALSRS